jgi:hypothetical protein
MPGAQRFFLGGLCGEEMVAEAGSIERPVLFEMNRIHVNAPKRSWTWIAGLYAIGPLIPVDCLAYKHYLQ